MAKLEKSIPKSDRKKFCPICETSNQVVEKKISIPIGNESFVTKTLVCENFGHYALTPEIRRNMDDWGRKLTKHVIEPQPIFAEAVHEFAEEIASQYGIKRVPFFRVLTAFYLNHVVNRADFSELKKYCESHVSSQYLKEGKRSKISVPIRYLMFRKIQIFSDVWEVGHAKTIEEAVLFGLVVLSSEKKI